MIRRDARSIWILTLGAVAVAASALAWQDASSQERRREQWQKVDEIFEAMGVRPGITVADIGAGDGFFTTRLARAVGPDGQVYAVDIAQPQLDRLRRRLTAEDIGNVTVVQGAPDDPRLPATTFDAALIVNAYHEMEDHRAMLASVRRALKPDGRLVIVEPISDRRRGASRAEQVRSHEIAPEHVVAEARSAGFRIVGLQDPFAMRDHDVEWLLVLQPHETSPSSLPSTREEPVAQPAGEELEDPSLRITLEEFRTLVAAGGVTIVDVRDEASFRRGHIPGALSIPLASVGDASERLRRLGKPIVTYCS